MAMANPEHVTLLERGVTAWNEWWQVHHSEDMRRAEAYGEAFSGANLRAANLARRQLSGAVFYQAGLSFATLTEAQLVGADLRHADLSSANLRGARSAATIALDPASTGTTYRFERYNIVSDGDLGEAAGKLDRGRSVGGTSGGH